jgi:hypothetical protein
MVDKNKPYPSLEDQYDDTGLDEIDKQDREDFDNIEQQDAQDASTVASDNQTIYNKPSKNIDSAKVPSIIDQLFGTPLEAHEPANADLSSNLEDYLTSGPTKPQVDKIKEPSEITTPKTDIPKPEKKALDSDQTAYDVMTGLPIGPATEGSVYDRMKESDLAQRNFIVGPITEKLTKGEEVTQTDLENASYVESILGGIENNLIKIPYTFHYISAAIKDAMAEDGVEVEDGEIAKVTKQIQSIEFLNLGKITKASSEAEKQTALGEIAGFIAAIWGPGKFVEALGLANSITGWAATGKLMLGSGENVVRAAEVANALNNMTRTGRFVAIAAGDAAGGLLTNALIADTSQVPTFGDLFGHGPTVTDSEEKKYANEEGQRLLLNRLKFGIEGAIIPVVFAFGKSKPYAEAARQTQDMIKNDHELEAFLDKVGKEKIANTPDTLESLAPVTLYAGIPFDAMAALAKQAGKPVYEFLKDTANLAKKAGMPVYDYIKKTIIPTLRTNGKLDEELAAKILDVKGEQRAVKQIDAVDAKRKMDVSLNGILKRRSLLQQETAPEIINATDEFLHSGEDGIVKIVKTPEGRIITTSEGVSPEANKMTEGDKIKETTKVEKLRAKQNEAFNNGDYITFGSAKDEADKLDAAIYKNKKVVRNSESKISNVTEDDIWDYYKFKNPKDIPNRYSNYPGEHWTDRARAASRTSKGLPAEAPSIEALSPDVLLNSEGNVIGKVTGKKLEFKGFGNALNEYTEKLKKFNLNDEEINELIKNASDTRQKIVEFFNAAVHPDVMEEALVNFKNILRSRTNKFLNSEYAIFNNKSVRWGYSYAPAKESIDKLRNIFIENATKDGVTLTEGDLNAMLNSLAEASLNAKTLTPEFTIRNVNKLSGLPDRLTINLKNSIDAEGKFVSNEIIKTGKQLEEFEKYFGKVKDVGSNVYTLIEDAGIYAARSKFYQDLQELNANTILSGKTALFKTGSYADAETYFNSRGIKSKDIVEFKPDSKYLNSFNGPVYTTKDIAEALSLSEKIPFSKLYQNGFYRNFITPIQSYLSAKNTVLSAPREILNGVQYSLMSIWNGNVFRNPTEVWRDLKESFRVAKVGLSEGFANSANVKDRELYRTLISKNIGMTHLNIGNLEDILKDNNIFNKIVSGEIEPSYKTIGGTVQKVYQFSKNFYMSTDNAFKFFNVLGEYANLKNAFEKAVKEGIVGAEIPSSEKLLDMAAKRIQDTMPNYAKVSEAVKTFSKLPFMGNYILWPSEMIRNVYSGYRIALQDLNNPITRGLGIQRLASMSITLGVLGGGVSAAWNPIVGYTNEKLGALRRFVSKYSTYSNLLGVPDDKYGRPGYIDFDHFNPYSNVTAPFTVLSAALNEGKFKNPDDYLINSALNAVWQTAVKTTESYRQDKLVVKPIFDLVVRGGRTAEGKEIWSPEDDFEDKLQKGSEYLWHEFLPPYEFGTRLYRAYSNTPDQYGQRYNKLDETLNLLGLRVRRIDPVQGFDWKMSKYNAVNHKIFTDLSKFNRDYENNDNDEFVKEAFKQNSKKYDAMTELAADYKASKTLGGNEDDIIDNHPSQKKLLGSLEDEGQFMPIKGYVKSLEKDITKKEQQMEKYFSEEKGIKMPDKQDIIDKISDMELDMQDVPLGKKLKNFININNYLEKQGLLNRIFNKPAVAPLPIQPRPNAQIINPNNQQGVINTQTGTLSKAEEYKQLFNT